MADLVRGAPVRHDEKKTTAFEAVVWVVRTSHQPTRSHAHFCITERCSPLLNTHTRRTLGKSSAHISKSSRCRNRSRRQFHNSRRSRDHGSRGGSDVLRHPTHHERSPCRRPSVHLRDHLHPSVHLRGHPRVHLREQASAGCCWSEVTYRVSGIGRERPVQRRRRARRRALHPSLTVKSSASFVGLRFAMSFAAYVVGSKDRT